MSFDLYLCTADGTNLADDRLKNIMASVQNMTEVDNGISAIVQFHYDNQATGVYCLFELSAQDDLESDEPIVPRGLTPQLSVAINFLRPHFFALETMPLITDISKSLGLFIYDPQDDRTHPPGTPPDVLIETWLVHNERAIKSVAQGDDPIRKPFLSRDRSLYWWQYTRAKEAYQQGLSDDVFVPSILLMADPDNRVKLTVIWSADVQRRLLKLSREPLPQIFPMFDFLLLAWGQSGERYEKRLVAAGDAEIMLRPVLEQIEGPVQGLRILRPNRQSEAAKVFDRLPKSEIGEMKQLPPDGFVDVAID